MGLLRVLREKRPSEALVLQTPKTLQFETKEFFLISDPIGKNGGLSLNTLNKYLCMYMGSFFCTCVKGVKGKRALWGPPAPTQKNPPVRGAGHRHSSGSVTVAAGATFTRNESFCITGESESFCTI